MWWLTAQALAHPGYGGIRPSHRVELEILEDQVLAHTSSRIPLHDVLAELEADDIAFSPEEAERVSQARLEELRSFLILRADGERLPWRVVEGSEPSQLTDQKYIFYEQDLVVDWPSGAGELMLENGNTPDVASFFWVDFAVDPGWVVEGSSLLVVEDGQLSSVRTGQWRMEEAMREVTVTLRPAGPLERWQREDTPLTLKEARAPELGKGWLVGLVLVGLAGLGYAAARASRP